MQPNPVLSNQIFALIENETHQESGKRSLRRDCEERIAKLVIADLLACGYSLDMNDGEDTTVKDSVDAKAIFAAMFTTDEDRLFVHKPGKPRSLGWVLFIYGNSGPDVINDYTTNLEKSMPRAFELAGEYA